MNNTGNNGDDKPHGYSLAPLQHSRFGQNSPSTATLDQPDYTDRTIPETAQNPAHANTLPHRPRGQLFVGLFLSFCLVFFCYTMWNTFYRYEAYGVVNGQIVDVPTAVEGRVKAFNIKKGQSIKQGEVLAVLENLTLKRQRERYRDDLYVARGKLAAARAELRQQQSERINELHQVKSDRDSIKKTLINEMTELEEAKRDVEQLQKLYDARYGKTYERGVYGELDSAIITHEGLKNSIKHLNTSLDEMNKWVATAKEVVERSKSEDSLTPIHKEISLVQHELRWVEELLAQCEIQSPVDGVIVDNYVVVGEYCRVSDTIVSIPDQSSIEIQLFLNQKYSNMLNPGDTIDILCEPFDQPIPCQVTRIDAWLQSAPKSIEKHYRKNESLLPIYLTPVNEEDKKKLKLGQVVKLP